VSGSFASEYTSFMARLPLGDVVLFDYRIDALLAVNAGVESYVASLPATGERVVVKVPAFLARPDEQRALTQEGAFLAQVRHPNVVAFLQGGFLDDGTPAYAREFIDGPTLGEVLQRRGAFPFWEALLVVLQLLDGLAVMHSAALFHRGICPEGIRIEADTGIAKFVSFGRPSRHYIAPETRKPGGAAGARTDLHGIGLLLYRLLTGEDLIDDDGRVLRPDLLTSIVPSLPLPPSRPPVPAELARLVAELLEPDPVARPADVGTVVGVIEDVLRLYAPKAAPDAPETVRGSQFPPNLLPEDLEEDRDSGWD
jgi:serine/threonine-protein kinase